jgi:hypothetical protein
MTAAEQFQMSAELALALSKIGDALDGLARFTDLATIHHLDGRTKIFLAQFHLREAAALVTRQTTGQPEATPPTLEDHIALAKKQLGCNDPLPPSAEDARAASALGCGAQQPLSSPEASQTHTEDSRPINGDTAPAGSKRAAQGEEIKI